MPRIFVVGCTYGPGLGPCLQAGLQFTKKLIQEHEKAFIPVHHMEAHLLTGRLVSSDVHFPFLTLLATGGHCLLLLARSLGQYQCLGSTLDDAPGEALDKVVYNSNYTREF